MDVVVLSVLAVAVGVVIGFVIGRWWAVALPIVCGAILSRQSNSDLGLGEFVALWPAVGMLIGWFVRQMSRGRDFR